VGGKLLPPLFYNEELQLSRGDVKVFVAVGPAPVCGAIQIPSVLRSYTLAAEFSIEGGEEGGSFKTLLLALVARLD